MKTPLRGLSSPDMTPVQTGKFYRNAAGVGSLTYLAWWFFVELTLPGSFNPLGSRLAVVLYCLLVFAGCFFSTRILRSIRWLFSSCIWLVTAHYFYLFHFNQADINWVVGCYITVIAAAAFLQSTKELLAYSAWVTFLSVGLILRDRLLLATVFLPGILTILIFAYVALRMRLQWLERAREALVGFENLFNAAFEGVVVHDQGLILDVNESFANIFGYRVDEVIGMRVLDFVAAEARNLTQDHIESQSEKLYRISGTRKDGSRVPIEIRGKKFMRRGKTLRIATVSDITARIEGEQDRVLYEASERAVHMRDEFLSVASHELKTPLTNIKIQTQMALRALKRDETAALTPAKMRLFVEQTDRQADRLTRLVEEMLDVTRISNGKLKIERENFDLAKLIRDVASAFDGALEQSGSTLEIFSPPSSRIEADRFRIEQVISNLLSNAIKYGNGGPILIRVEESELETRIVVQDQGIGILKENQERIFRRFERAISSRNISGLGLGLYIAKDIVEAHRGRIEVESRFGHGARFTVFLPLTAL